MNAFFKSQFSYPPLSKMFHSCILNNKINRLHKRCLRIIYNDNASSLAELLEIDNGFLRKVLDSAEAAENLLPFKLDIFNKEKTF